MNLYSPRWTPFPLFTIDVHIPKLDVTVDLCAAEQNSMRT